jgi:hypothetical protein
MKTNSLLKLISLVVLAAMLASACTTAKANPAGENQVVEVTDAPQGRVAKVVATEGPDMISFHRSGGFAGVDEQWTFYAEGKVVTAKGAEQAFEAAKVETLLSDIETLGFFELQDSYGSKFSACKDCFSYEITISRNGQVKTITFTDGSDVPAELTQAIEKIDSLISSLPQE